MKISYNMKKIALTILLSLSLFISKSQNIVEKDTLEIQNKLFTKCFENLNQGLETFQKYPALQKNPFCTILDCLFLLSYQEEDIKRAAENRLRGIATQFFNRGNPVYLTSGMDSYFNTEKANQNIEDENHVIYISIGDCIIPQGHWIGMQVFNEQTKKLIDKKLNANYIPSN